MIAVWFWDEVLPIPEEPGVLSVSEADTVVTAASLRDAIELTIVNVVEAGQRGEPLTGIVLWDGVVQGMLTVGDDGPEGLWTELAEDLLDQIEDDARRGT